MVFTVGAFMVTMCDCPSCSVGSGVRGVGMTTVVVFPVTMVIIVGPVGAAYVGIC
jgi:hypothetical protein